jgi:hypothetical protein
MKVIILLSAFAASAYAQYWLSTTPYPYHTIPPYHQSNQSISHELVLEQPTLIAAL